MDYWILLKLKFSGNGDFILKYYIGLGSNMGVRENYLKVAINELMKIGKIGKKSAIYESEPAGYKNQNNFLNALCTLYFDKDIFSLLKQIKRIEKKLGREETIKWGPRVIDLDIIDCDGQKIKSDKLNIPHPEMQKRNFVLLPLSEIEPDYRHKNGKMVKQLLEVCPEAFIRRYKKQW